MHKNSWKILLRLTHRQAMQTFLTVAGLSLGLVYCLSASGTMPVSTAITIYQRNS